MSKAKELLDKHLILKGVQKTLVVNGAVYVACRNAVDEALTIHSVSQQRELLLDFLGWQSKAYSCINDEVGNKKEIEAYLKSNNCG